MRYAFQRMPNGDDAHEMKSKRENIINLVMPRDLQERRVLGAEPNGPGMGKLKLKHFGKKNLQRDSPLFNTSIIR